MPSERLIFNKLVRDRIVPDIQQYGGEPEFFVLDKGQHIVCLYEKASEEILEIFALGDNPERSKMLAEAADLQEVYDVLYSLDRGGRKSEEMTDLKETIRTMCMFYKISDAELVQAQHEKREQQGSFDEGHYIKTTTYGDEDPWRAYCEKKYAVKKA